MKKEKSWARLLAYITGLVNQDLLLQNEYLAAENRILRARLPSRLRLSDPERETLAEIGKRLGRKALAQVAVVAKPDTMLAWYRRLIAQKFALGKRWARYGLPDTHSASHLPRTDNVTMPARCHATPSRGQEPDSRRQPAERPPGRCV